MIKLLLRDLGPRTASEIKEELSDLVIPAADWNRWWQTARTKIKKDTKIASPKELKDPFVLRTEEVPHEISLHKALEKKPGVHATIQMVYNFIRDFPETLKNQEFRSSLELAAITYGQQRIGVGVNHLSNAHLSSRNPGANSIVFFYAF